MGHEKDTKVLLRPEHKEKKNIFKVVKDKRKLRRVAPNPSLESQKDGNTYSPQNEMEEKGSKIRNDGDDDNDVFGLTNGQADN